MVGEGGQRVEAEGFLPSRRGLLFLRVGDHDRGVQVDGDQAAIRAWRVLPGQRPHPLARRRTGGPDGLQRPRQVGGQSADQPGRHRVGRDRPGQLRLLPQHRDIGQAVPAQGDRGGQVRNDLAPGRGPPAAPATCPGPSTGAGPGRSPASFPTAARPRPETPGPGRQQTP